MGISYVTFLKHAAKVTKASNNARPMLKGVRHSIDGSLAVTDSHRLYLAENAYETSVEVVKNAKTGEVIEGNYPDVSRLVLRDGEWFKVELDVPKSVNALKAMLIAVKANGNESNSQVRFSLDNDRLIITAGNDKTPLFMTYNIGKVDKGSNEEVKAAVDGQYLYESLDLIRDLGFTTATLKFFGNMRPFTICNKDITTLMLPVREV